MSHALDPGGDGLRDLVVGNGAGDIVRFPASHLAGDLDDSKKVDAADWVRLARALGSRRGDARFDPVADLDDDADVDRDDRDRLLADLGRVY